MDWSILQDVLRVFFFFFSVVVHVEDVSMMNCGRLLCEMTIE